MSLATLPVGRAQLLAKLALQSSICWPCAPGFDARKALFRCRSPVERVPCKHGWCLQPLRLGRRRRNPALQYLEFPDVAARSRCAAHGLPQLSLHRAGSPGSSVGGPSSLIR